MQSVVGVLQYVTGGGFLKGVFGVPQTSFVEISAGSSVLSRVGGTIGHPNMLGRYLCFCITILLGYGFARINRYLGNISLATVIVAGLVLLLTMSRGSWAALGLTFIFLFYHIFRHFFGSRLKAAIAVIIFNVLLTIFTLLAFEDVHTRLFETDYGRAKTRITMAQVAINIIRENPLTGIGLNNYTYAMNPYDHTRNWQSYKWRHPVHNSYLLIAAESGLPALAAFIWMIAAFFMSARSVIKAIKNPMSLFVIGCMGGVLTWLLAGLFDRDHAGLTEMLWFTIALAVASNQIIRKESRTE
jgi:O-antigen ligase